MRGVGGRIPDIIDGRKSFSLVLWGQKMDQAVQRYTRHDVDKKTETLACDLTPGKSNAHLTTLSMEWKTSELRHMTIAMALFPYARQ
jgi:hypothetical protein